jgi:hypothetical protein
MAAGVTKRLWEMADTEAPDPARDNPGFVSDTISERWAASYNGRHHLGAVRLCDPGGWRGVGAGGNYARGPGSKASARALPHRNPAYRGPLRPQPISLNYRTGLRHAETEIGNGEQRLAPEIHRSGA